MNRYTKTTMLLHWLMGVFIVGNFLLGLTMSDMPISPSKLQYYNWHKWVGVTIFALACLRLLWRIGHAPPAYPASMSPNLQKIAHATHHLLYLLFFAVPITGYFYTLAAGFPVVFLGVIPLPVLIGPNPELKEILKEAHELISWGLAVVVLAHIGAAIKHQYIDKDGIMKRISPF